MGDMVKCVGRGSQHYANDPCPDGGYEYRGKKNEKPSQAFIELEASHGIQNAMIKSQIERVRNGAPMACGLSDCHHLPTVIGRLLEFAHKSVSPPPVIGLREKLAAQAMAGMLANPSFDANADVATRLAFEQADSMISFLEKGEDGR